MTGSVSTQTRPSFPSSFHARAIHSRGEIYVRSGGSGPVVVLLHGYAENSENPAGPTTTESFAPEALYKLKIDTDGDGVADIAYRLRFSAFERGAQTAILRRLDGPQAAGTGDGGRVIVDGAAVSTGREARITEAGDTRFFAGWRSDPFFCDVEGAKNNLQFTGDDFFADKCASSHTCRRERDAYLRGKPANDERFLAGFAHALEHTGGYTPAEAKRVAGTLLPDFLPYDPTRPASFPDNCRILTDDAFDSFIRILTNGKVTEDKVGPDGDLLLEFPYMGPPHQKPRGERIHKTTAMQNQT